MNPDDSAPEPIVATFEIGDRHCISYFDAVDEAYEWLIAQQGKGILQPTMIFQSNTVWKDERDFKAVQR